MSTAADIADEYLALADLLERADACVWDAPSLCVGWRTREVVAHVTMPVRYDGPAFMAELAAAGGDFSRLSNLVADRDGALAEDALLAGLRSSVLHEWEPPGGGAEGALVHCVIHTLDIVEAVPLPRRVPADRLRAALGIVTATEPDNTANLFGVDLSDVTLQADDLDWCSGSGSGSGAGSGAGSGVGGGSVVTGPAQALAVLACGRLLPPGRVGGDAAARFTQQ